MTICPYYLAQVHPVANRIAPETRRAINNIVARNKHTWEEAPATSTPPSQPTRAISRPVVNHQGRKMAASEASWDDKVWEEPAAEEQVFLFVLPSLPDHMADMRAHSLRGRIRRRARAVHTPCEHSKPGDSDYTTYCTRLTTPPLSKRWGAWTYSLSVGSFAWHGHGVARCPTVCLP